MASLDIFFKVNNKGADQIARMRSWSVPLLFANPQRQVFLVARPKSLYGVKSKQIKL